MARTHTGSKNAKHDRPRGPLGTQLAQGREGQLACVLEACARVLRPLVRLALAYGIKYAHLEELLRDLLLDEARHA